MTAIKRIPKDFSTVFLFDILAKVFGAAITVFLIRMLSVEQYAEYTKFVSISTFINGVFGTGIALSFVRYMTENISRGNKHELGLYSSCIISLLFLFVLSLLIKDVIADVYIVRKSIVIYSSCFGFFLAMLHINQSYFQSFEQYMLGGLFGNGRYFLSFFAVLFLLLSGRNFQLSTILIVLIVSGAAAFSAGIVNIYKDTPPKMWFKGGRILFEMLQSSTWLVLYCALLNLLNQLDVLMLTNRLGDVAVAEYGVAYKYYGLCLSLLPAIMTVLRVRSSKKDFVDSAQMRKQFSKHWIKRVWLFAVAFCITAMILSTWVLPFLNGDQYSDSVAVFRVLSVGVGLSYSFAANVHMMMSARKHKQLCFLSAIALVSNYCINSLLIPIWGAVGAAIATVISQAIINVTSTFIILRQRDDTEGSSSCD